LSFALLMLRRDKMKLVDLRPIKDKALGWPEPVRILILSEPDRISFPDFLVKVNTWERALKIKGGK